MSPVPRRRFLSGLAATTGIAASAGCLGSLQETKFSLYTRPLGDSLAEVTDGFVLSDPTAIQAQQAVDYSDDYKRSVVDTLFENGRADAVQWELTYDTDFGTTSRPLTRFLERDGRYYAVFRTDETTFTEQRWVFYLDRVDEEPTASDTVVTGPPSSLSETDRLLVERAVETVRMHGDVDGRPLDGRGPSFHHELDPETSDLVPSAPFDYLRLDDWYLVPRAERGPIDLTRYTYRIEEVATSQAELAEHVASNVVVADFDPDADAPATAVLRDATSVGNGRIHTERSEDGTMSDGLAEVTARLGLSSHIPDDVSQRLSFDDVVFSFGDRWYDSDFTVRRVF
ncbi:hypothetical protein SAMN04487949_2388 [Halogranum gelatinilyticum]|uniref:Uncharacterized protein n=1 Tax=Halogranum gelatinilyticum TaxID=660521 RepID=A0A1G9VI11_9EURY|nr:hypothetical protein [Halogranum gelatinilyticum]SDM71789.1 hypothetical protein SAMN04487949_2388 [Halogranum gelatinilyticum]